MNVFSLCWVFKVLFLKVQKYPILEKKKKEDSVSTASSNIKGLIPYLWKKHLHGKYTLNQAQLKGARELVLAAKFLSLITSLYLSGSQIQRIYNIIIFPFFASSKL